jgi:hypothetical protein
MFIIWVRIRLTKIVKEVLAELEMTKNQGSTVILD